VKSPDGDNDGDEVVVGVLLSEVDGENFVDKVTPEGNRERLVLFTEQTTGLECNKKTHVNRDKVK
jgi:hypothetical protein